MSEAMLDLRLRTQITDRELEQKVGKIVTDDDYNVVLTGPCTLRSPEGPVAAVYLPGALLPHLAEHPTTYEILHSLRGMVTDNRGDASGSKRFRYGDEKRTRSKKVASCILGAFDPGGPKQFCRLAAWTASHHEHWVLLRPFFQSIAGLYQQWVPQRYDTQLEVARATHPAWVIPGTPFTTITVNNTYPTGVHRDMGDLKEGFSTLAVLRRGGYLGGRLVLVRYRVAVDLHDGDLLLFDPHQWHGNTAIETLTEDAERISVVSYYRSGMVQCGPPDEEYRKAVAYAERRGGSSDSDGDDEGA